MNTRKTYQGTLVSLGLFPLISTLIGLHLLPAPYALGIGLTLGLTAIAINIACLKDINFFLLSSNISIALCLLFYLFSGYRYIPSSCITPALELLMLIFCFIYMTLPDYYQKLHRMLRLQTRRNYTVETCFIVILSAMHLILVIIFQKYHLLDSPRIFAATIYLIPVLIYILCIVFNVTGIRMAAREEKFCNIVRIAPLWNGKIYLCPHTNTTNWETTWNIPIEEHLESPLINIEHHTARLCRKITQKKIMAPRLILQYHRSPEISQLQTVHLFILPLKEKQELALQNGRFFDFEELKNEQIHLSDLLRTELEHLDLAASMWKEFY
ncbi:hypothetical protein [uncultured Phocaeicola sp.]|uniref:hypothetical protein n=1 Tax=uncultured Phocaeicola sp. TaxID=990718 RepID=UPI0025E20E31|nr:hypothetical protein [uncultured Phocaeicola sp.]